MTTATMLTLRCRYQRSASRIVCNSYYVLCATN